MQKDQHVGSTQRHWLDLGPVLAFRVFWWSSTAQNMVSEVWMYALGLRV